MSSAPLTRRSRFGVISVGVIVTLALALWIVPLPPDWVERYYSSSSYLAWQQAITPIGNRVPIALFDLLLMIVTIGLFVTVLWRFRRAERGRRLRSIGRALLDVGAVAAVLAIWFSLAWGTNYRRQPLRDRLDFDRTRITRTAAIEMAQTTVREMNRLHALAHAAPQPFDSPSSSPPPSSVPASATASSPSLEAVQATLTGAFNDVQRDLGLTRVAASGRPKATLLQPYFRWAAIDGLTDPFFLETLVNSDALPIERPFIVAHEWSHLAGFAHEAEANFLGFAICQRGGPQAQYSAWLSLYWHFAAGLPPADRRVIDAALQEGPRADLRAVVERYQRSAPQVRVVAWSAYDTFLKANRVTEGVASYDGVVALVLGTTFAPGWRPVVKNAAAPPSP